MIIARRPGCLDDVREKRGDEDGATERVARVCAARHRRGRQTIYCARGQAENLIKLHKAQLDDGMIVLFWSRATRDLLKSFGWGIAALVD